MVIVDGRVVVEGGRLLTMDEEVVWRDAARRAEEIVARAGLSEKVKGRWPTM